ncbi:phosphotransferase family protein [Paenibacillus tengchongensis]|uniref:phosphotransferase family protein n=1 Tax=Paenibacillus tengchongensis TaxID=2608684 RepID=UPI00124EF6C1|nr:aminoglycoside phosphotransferase family protein [Paenibacillus tengchongensis]
MEGKRVGIGRTAEVFVYGDGTILKLYREEIDGYQVEREYRISKHVYEQGLRTPQPLELVEAEGRQGIVFEQVQGVSLLKLIGEKPLQLSAFAAQLAGLHAGLHQLEGPDPQVRQKEQLEKCIIAAPMLTMDEKSAVLEQLARLPAGDRLCHGDFHPDNVLVGGEAWVIDWMTGIAGHPDADAARTVLLLSMGAMPPGTPLLRKFVTGFFRQRLTKLYIREYLRLTGKNYSAINAWIVPVASARLWEGVPLGEKEQLAREIRRRLRKSSK